MKHSLLILFLLAGTVLYGQAERVHISNRIYNFLERMENLNILENYNSFEIPKTRKEIAEYLVKVSEKRNELNAVDKEMLNDFETEFHFDITGNTDKHHRIIQSDGYNYLSDDQKYLYYLADPDFNVFINLYGEFEYLHSYKENSLNNNAAIGKIGGIIRGSVNRSLGFYINGSNGLVSGNTEAALTNKMLQQNFKFNEKPDERFFDYTEGHLSGDYDIIKFNLGREKIQIGYGNILIIDDNSPVFDNFGFKLNYKFFSYSFSHSKVLDYDPEQLVYSDKFVVYHRIGFNLSRHFDFGAGELAIYGRRGLDLAYLNPFSFYKSVEHSNRDRDNSMLFFDVNNNSIPGTKLHALLLIDDITYGKIGTGWYGNTVMLNAGVYSSNILGLPVDLSADYRRTEPYTFTHRLRYNNFTNLEYALSTYAIPNSELFKAELKYRLNYRLEISSAITYIIHGANAVSDGEIVNYGGDIYLGYRENDSQTVRFLEGEREYYRRYNLGVFYEIINETYIKFHFDLLNFSTKSEQSHREFQTLITLTTVF